MYSLVYRTTVQLVYNFVLSTGKGCVFSFDPVGSYEKEVYRAAGSASALLQPLLDNQVMLSCYCN